MKKDLGKMLFKRQCLSVKLANAIPKMGFGTFSVKDPRMILNAFAIGYRHFDLAESYGNLPAVKHAISHALLATSEGGFGIPRDEIWLTMKITNLKEDGVAHINNLLSAVGVEYFDLLLFHYPYRIFESKNKLEAAWRQMTELPKHLIKHVGVSNIYVEHLLRLLMVCKRLNLDKPYANEIEINPYVYSQDEQKVIFLCEENDIQLIAYSPLGYANGLIMLTDEKLWEIAETLSITTAQLSLGWLMSKNFCVIPKSDYSKRQEENFSSTEYIQDIVPYSLEIDEISDLRGGDICRLDGAMEARNHSAMIRW